MRRTVAVINRRRFAIPAGEDVEALRREIEEAVRAGGGFVAVPILGSRSLDVLFSVGTSVVFEEDDIPDVEPGEAGENGQGGSSGGDDGSGWDSAHASWRLGDLNLDLEI